MTRQKTLVIIPAYNEEENIGEVIADIRKENLDLDVLIVNDGSKDQTKEKALSFGIEVLDLPINLGIGGARQAGLIYARKKGYNCCIQMDADGQHPAKNLKNLILSANNNEVVIGSRFLKKGRYRGAVSRRLGMIILSSLLYLITGEKITDPTSGLRVISGRAILFLAKYYPVDYPEVEPIVFLHWAGFRVKETSVKMEQRRSGKSSIAPISYMVKVILAVLIDCLREKPKIN